MQTEYMVNGVLFSKTCQLITGTWCRNSRSVVTVVTLKK